MSTASSRNPTLAEILRAVIDERLTQIHTVMPGRIKSYDAAKQVAEVEICLRRRTPLEDGDTLIEEFPILPNVRVEFPQTSGFFMSFPLAQGDFVWVHFAEQSLDRWFEKGSVQTENTADPLERRFDLSDAWAIPARDPESPIEETQDNAIVIGAKGSSNARAYFKEGEIALGEENPSSYVALATKVNGEFNKLSTTINSLTSPSGSVTAGTPYVRADVDAATVKAK
jgi:hypothetical protein